MSPCDDCGLPVETGNGVDDDLCVACTSLRNGDRRIRITPLAEDDLELVLAWRSHPRVYRHFRNQDAPLSWEQHVGWFESRSDDRHDFVVWYGGRRVGVVTLDADDAVSIYVGDFSARGEGVATVALRWLCERLHHRSPLQAEIHEENAASQRLFERCGFEQTGRDGEWLVYRYGS